MPRPVRRNTTTPAARGGALVFIRGMLLKTIGVSHLTPIIRCSPPERALARGGGGRRRIYSDGEASCESVRALKPGRESVLEARQCFDRTLERQFPSFRSLEVGDVTRAHVRGQRGRRVLPELGFKHVAILSLLRTEVAGH